MDEEGEEDEGRQLVQAEVSRSQNRGQHLAHELAV